MTRVLLVGETWLTDSTHHKGWDSFPSGSYHSGAGAFLSALEPTSIQVDHMPAHEAAEAFPGDVQGLRGYDVVLLSDVGSNTLLLHPDTWLHGRPTPNRLALLADWVQDGGGLAMFGGYMSFQGLHGHARYHDTPVEDVLPVKLTPYDDRVEVPEGFTVEVAGEHPILREIGARWPILLGYNRVLAKDHGEVLARRGDDPLLVVGTAGRGRTLAWMSDIGPHWCPHEFSSWPGYATLWEQALTWLGGNA